MLLYIVINLKNRSNDAEIIYVKIILSVIGKKKHLHLTRVYSHLILFSNFKFFPRNNDFRRYISLAHVRGVADAGSKYPRLFSPRDGKPVWETLRQQRQRAIPHPSHVREFLAGVPRVQ